jgi:hypothetical protein
VALSRPLVVLVKETNPGRRTYSPAEAAADLAFYQRLKRAVWLGTPLALALPAAVLAFWNPWYAISLGAGGAAGIANARLSMYGNERLLERRSVVPFVISSFVRIGLFGIVPVILAVRAPSVWTLGWYFAGFFVPLVFSGIIAILRERSG